MVAKCIDSITSFLSVGIRIHLLQVYSSQYRRIVFVKRVVCIHVNVLRKVFLVLVVYVCVCVSLTVSVSCFVCY